MKGMWTIVSKGATKKRTPLFPLPDERYIFKRDSTEYFTTGETYTVIKTGTHWHKEFGEGIWMTYDDHPHNPQRDEDFCVFIGVGYLKEAFFKH